MLRFFQLLEIFTTRYQLHLHVVEAAYQLDHYGLSALAGYETNLHNLGISVQFGGEVYLQGVLRRHAFEIVFFEHYQCAVPYIDDVRFTQPDAKIVIDTIDLNFERLLSKARVSQKRQDLEAARKEKAAELSAYRRSDLVIAISDQEKQVLMSEDPCLNVEVIPLIFPLPELRPPRDGTACDLIFVGNFEHAANTDAMFFFCETIFSALKNEIPYAKLRIVGNAATEAVNTLANADIEVLGFVPDIKPYYENSDISIAPLTWGGGLKGKVAEAMSFGLPVVATAIGMSGFDLRPGENILLGDTPEEFVKGVVMLHRDRQCYEKIRMNGWRFVETNYSGAAIRSRIDEIFAKLQRYRAKRLPLRQRLTRKIADLLHVDLLSRSRYRRQRSQSL